MHSNDDVLTLYYAECTQSDCIQPYIFSTTQVNCVEETRRPNEDCRWPAGMTTLIKIAKYLLPNFFK